MSTEAPAAEAPQLQPQVQSLASEAVIVCRDLGRNFGSRAALSGISFSLPAGAFLTVLGANGAGKSTLLRMLATLLRPSAGSLSILGADPQREAEAIRARIGLISHRSMIYPDLTSEENLLLLARLYGVPEPEARVSELLQLVGLTARRHDRARGFSRGMTQRLAIARALVHDPELLLLDEPYAGLDPHATAVLDELLASIRAERSFVMVSHDLERGLAPASHVLVLSRGRQQSFGVAASLDRESLAESYRAGFATALRQASIAHKSVS